MFIHLMQHIKLIRKGRCVRPAMSTPYKMGVASCSAACQGVPHGSCCHQYVSCRSRLVRHHDRRQHDLVAQLRHRAGLIGDRHTEAAELVVRHLRRESAQ